MQKLILLIPLLGKYVAANDCKTCCVVVINHIAVELSLTWPLVPQVIVEEI